MFRSAVDTLTSLCVFTFLFLLGVASFSSAADNAINRYVIAISANNGGPSRPLLRYAQSDALSFVDVLKDMGGVQPLNAILVQEPSVKYLNARMDDLDKVISRHKGDGGRQEILVYYSGHADEKGLRLGAEVYPWKDFRKRIDAMNADVKIAVIDACGSGAITRAKGGVAVPAFMMDKSSDMKGYAFITSSTQDESSQESDRLRGSFFTHSLVSGLRGAGDLSGDGKVTLSEAYQFAFNETLQKTQSTMGGAQHPSRDMNLAGTGDVVMTDLRSVGAGVSFHKNLEGRLFIRDGRGVLVAELYKASGREMSLGLPAGNYEIHLENSARHSAAKVALVNRKMENVTQENFSDVAVERTVARGEILTDKSCVQGDTAACSLDSLERNAAFRTTFNAVDVEFASRKGFQLGLFATVASDYMIGSQVSVIANIARKEFHGIQISTTLNFSKDHLSGAQIASTFNYARSFDGLQLASLNVSPENSSGVQVGVVNAAGSIPVQVGVINAVNKIEGPQVGVINVASKADGRQWGVINACIQCEKTPVGLINFVGNGLWNLTAAFNEMGGTGIKLDLGTAYFYTSFEVSRNFEPEKVFLRYDHLWESGLGVGTHLGRYGSHFDLEYMLLNVSRKVPYSKGDLEKNEKVSYHHRLRLGSTVKVATGIGLVGGLSLNISHDGNSRENPLKPMGDYHASLDDHHHVRLWPGFYTGFTIGRF